jgi:hypothetical protein
MLKSQSFCDIIAKAQAIVSAFHKPNKQYTILQPKMAVPTAFVLVTIYPCLRGWLVGSWLTPDLY